MKRNRLVTIPVILLLILCMGLAGVYYGVPIIQPCALLARVLPPPLLPPNPNVADPSFTPLPGARALYGQYACSGYRIEVPAQWNGDLVVYAHGFRGGSSPELTITDLPVREEAVRLGFAWAASSYRANGYNPLDGIADTLLVIEQFKRQVGEPKRMFIYGSSMGGHVVVGSLEQHPDVYVGGVAECGVVGGAAQLDYLLAVNALADELAGTNMFAPENKSLQAQQALMKNGVYTALGQPPAEMMSLSGLFGQVTPAPEIDWTAKGQAFRNSAIYLGGGPRPFAQEGFNAAYQIVVEVPRLVYAIEPALLRVGSNEDFTYQIDSGFAVDASALNADVRRVSSDPAARARYAFTGKLQDPLLTIHDTGDAFVPMYNEQVYRQLTQAAGKSDLLVQRAVRRFLHCDFSLTERNRAFDDLIAWVTNGVKPAGEDLSGSLLDAGRTWTDPLRPDDPGEP